MHFGKMTFAPINAYAFFWLLGFAFFAYLAWHAHQHMQKSMASRVLLVQAHQPINAPLKPTLALTDTFLAHALANEPSPSYTQDKAIEGKTSPKASDAASLESIVSAADKPIAQTDQVKSVDQPAQTKTSAQRKTTKNPRSKLPSLRLLVQHSSALLHATLMQAYQAYEDGDTASSENLYRQVLERDSTNVDAMLGMAAIAQRQGQQDGAAAWYQSVLAVAPNNTLALLAILPMQDKAYAESHIKSLLQGQPKAAHLHAALADLYAGQGLWSAAEEAYFDASQLAPNHAEYAFNLAVSLEHMGQPSLAFEQYGRALELLKPSASDSLSKELIETRMQALK
jgi:Tfp pilus assembly protein PilF